MVCVWGWSLVQRSPTECGMPECGREVSIMRVDWPTGGCWASAGGALVRRTKHLALHYVVFSTLLLPRTSQAPLSSSAPYSRTPSSHLHKLRSMINWGKPLFLRNRTVIRLIRALFFGFVFGATAPSGPGPPSFTRSLDHTQRRTTVGRSPVDEWPARPRDLHLTRHNKHDIHAPGGIRTHKLSRRVASDLRP